MVVVWTAGGGALCGSSGLRGGRTAGRTHGRSGRQWRHDRGHVAAAAAAADVIAVADAVRHRTPSSGAGMQIVVAAMVGEIEVHGFLVRAAVRPAGRCCRPIDIHGVLLFQEATASSCGAPVLAVTAAGGEQRRGGGHAADAARPAQRMVRLLAVRLAVRARL